MPIHYEARIARIQLDEDQIGQIDEEFDEAVEGLARTDASAAARKWTQVESLIGVETRLDMIVADILEHFAARLQAIDGKAMIVCMSRRICVEVYNRIIASRPGWHDETDGAGAVKVVMTGSAADPASMQPHIRSKSRQEIIRNRYRDPDCSATIKVRIQRQSG